MLHSVRLASGAPVIISHWWPDPSSGMGWEINEEKWREPDSIKCLCVDLPWSSPARERNISCLTIPRMQRTDSCSCVLPWQNELGRTRGHRTHLYENWDALWSCCSTVSSVLSSKGAPYVDSRAADWMLEESQRKHDLFVLFGRRWADGRR